jgi:hypothetical protein
MRRALITAIAEWSVAASQQQPAPHWASSVLLEMLFSEEVRGAMHDPAV